MKRALFVVALAAAVLVVPAASATRAHRVKLALVVLPKPVIGAAARPLALSRTSGFVSDAGASNNSFSAGANTFVKLGRVTGYDLTFGDRYKGGPGITEISTGVDEYRTPADAKRGLAFWRTDGPKVKALNPYGLTYTVEALKAARVGTRRFAYGTTLAVPSAQPVIAVDEHFTEGRYELQVDVAAGSLSAAAGLAARLARKLDHRLQLARAGHLRGKPVKLPKQLKAGPPTDGPDLATLALTTADLGGSATIADEGYGAPTPPSTSGFVREMQPAGTFADLSQVIDWFRAANDATVLARFEGAGLAYLFSQGLLTGAPGQFAPVDLSAVGDNASGGIVTVRQTGQPTVYLAIVALSSAQAADDVIAGSQSPIQAADVATLAQTAADRLHAGLAG